METGANSSTLHTDRAYDPKQHSGQYHLSLLWDEEQFVACVIDQGKGHVVAMEQLPASTPSLFTASALLQESYASADASLADEQFTLIPAALFETNKKERYLDLLHEDGNRSYSTFSDFLPKAELQVVYRISQERRDALTQTFPYIKVRHLSSWYLDKLLSAYQDHSGRLTHVRYNGNALLITLLEDGKLRFHNRFAAPTAEDIAYYLLHVLEQHGWDAATSEIMACGTLPASGPTHELLQKYLPRLKYEARDRRFGYASFFHKFEAHGHFILFNQHLCE